MYDHSTTATVIMNLLPGATGSSSFTSNQCSIAGCSGGAIAISTVNALTLGITSTTFTSNYAIANGGAIFVDNTITGIFTATI